jgi:hypothetical protein
LGSVLYLGPSWAVAQSGLGGVVALVESNGGGFFFFFFAPQAHMKIEKKINKYKRLNFLFFGLNT